MANCVVEIAQANNRDYITPEDVSDALKSHDATKVRLDVLEVLGNVAGVGAEDHGLCAFIAHRGTPDS